MPCTVGWSAAQWRGVQARCPLKCRDRKRRYQSTRLTTVPDVIGTRKSELEVEVVTGARDAASLAVIPAELARRATVTFPPHPFGEPKPW